MNALICQFIVSIKLLNKIKYNDKILLYQMDYSRFKFVMRKTFAYELAYQCLSFPNEIKIGFFIPKCSKLFVNII